MKKFLIGCVLLIAILLASVVCVGIYGLKTLNSFASLDERTAAAWSQVENQYQRRADLIPNLVNTVKGYASHEQQTLLDVVQARNQAVGAQKPSANLNNEQTFRNYQQAQDGLTAALNRLLVVVEQYPDLKANQNFLALQTQLEGTENRIAVARQDYIQTVLAYNTKLRQIPAGWIAKTFGNYTPKTVFTASQGAKQVPEVSF